MSPQNRDPSLYQALPSTAAGAPIVPQVAKQTTTVNLGIGASIDFDFASDSAPIFDLLVFADQIITVVIFIQQAAGLAFRQWGNTYVMPAASTLWAPFSPGPPGGGIRIPGTTVRIELQNNSGVATTVLEAEVQQRSL